MKQPTPEEKTARAAEELRGLVRQAHETAQALGDMVKRAQDVLDQYRQTVHGLMIEETKPMVIEFTRIMHAALQDWLEDHAQLMHTQLTDQLDRWGKQLAEMTGGMLSFDGMVIDSRGELPRILSPDSEEARRLIDDPRQHKVVINPDRGGGMILRDAWKHGQ